MFSLLVVSFIGLISLCEARHAGLVVDRPLYMSRPDLNAPTLDVSLTADQAAPGYVFIAPYFAARSRPDPGPYIFDTLGSLIWSGVDDTISAGTSDVHGLHLCQHHSETHICYWKGRQRGIHGIGIGVIMNKHYESVATVKLNGAGATVDLHEFRVTADGTALVTGYSPRLSGDIWILDSIFREVDLETGQTFFSWSALDHVDLSDSKTPMGAYGALGDGFSNSKAWDFFHINSVDKTEVGDYIISSRHTDCVYKISRKNGSILWRLNGPRSSFEIAPTTFRRQHHARILRETPEHTVVSLFDNDDDGYTLHGSSSSGLILEIDHKTNSTREVLRIEKPGLQKAASESMGSVSNLPNSNYFIGWGANSTMTEHLPDGTPIWQANIGWESRNYRAFKGDWVGLPLQPPALWTSSSSEGAAPESFVSWNGATEVKYWRMYGSQAQDGPYELIGSTTKSGFETRYTHSEYWAWTMAEGVSATGEVLGRSQAASTTLANLSVVSHEDESRCAAGSHPGAGCRSETVTAVHKTEEYHLLDAPPERWKRSAVGTLERIFAVIGVLALCRVLYDSTPRFR